MSRHWLLVILSSVGAALATALAGCKPPANEYVPPPPPEVTVAHPIQGSVVRNFESTGTLEGVEQVEIRARVRGFLDKMHFTPGTVVKVGDPLFTIDPREYQAQVARAEADVQGFEAALKQAEIELLKIKEVQVRGGANQIEVDRKQADRDMAQANVAMGNAALDTAKLNLSFTDVRSPIDGRVGRNLVDLGSLVGSSEATLLTTVINEQQVYVYMNASETNLLEVTRRRGGRAADGPVPTPVELALGDEDDFPHHGRIDFVDNTVDPGTGTIRVRAIFDNSSRLLVPGYFVRVRLPFAVQDEILVPETATGADQAGQFVLALKDDDTVERRAVVLGRATRGMRPVTTGLELTDRIVINGLQRARPGLKVKPVLQVLDFTPDEVPSLTATSEMATTQPAMSPTGPTTKPQ